MVESQPSKLLVAGSIPVSRYALSASTKSRGLSDVEGAERRESKDSRAEADVAQLAERVLGKDEVTSSILVIGSTRLAAGTVERAWRVDEHDNDGKDFFESTARRDATRG